MSVLFVCAGNAARSQMAEAFYNHITDSVEAISAGTETIIGKDIPPFVIEVMREENIEIDPAKTKRKLITPEMVEDAGRVVLMTYRSLPEYLRKDPKIMHWNVADPRGLGIEAHRTTRDEIGKMVKELLHERHAA